MKDKYEIEINSLDVPSQDVKKLLISNGLHIYNIKEESKWTNGNENTKLIFQIRNINNSNKTSVINNCQEKLKVNGLNIKRSKDQVIIPDKKSDMFPVQAKWNDTNIRNYHISVENNKKPTKFDYPLKKGLPFDRNLLKYKNDKMNCNKTRKEADNTNKSQAIDTNTKV